MHFNIYLINEVINLLNYVIWLTDIKTQTVFWSTASMMKQARSLQIKGDKGFIFICKNNLIIIIFFRMLDVQNYKNREKTNYFNFLNNLSRSFSFNLNIISISDNVSSFNLS